MKLNYFHLESVSATKKQLFFSGTVGRSPKEVSRIQEANAEKFLRSFTFNFLVFYLKLFILNYKISLLMINL